MLQWLLALTANSSETSQTSSGSSSSASSATASIAAGADSDSVSGGLAQLAKFFSKLETLAQSDPTAFKQLTAQISTELSAAAKDTTGSEANALQQLSDKFKTASQTGSMASLEPTASGSQSDGTSVYGSTDQNISPLVLLALLANSSTTSDSTNSSTTSSTSSSAAATSSTSSSAAATSSTSTSTASQLGSLFQSIYNQVMQA